MSHFTSFRINFAYFGNKRYIYDHKFIYFTLFQRFHSRYVAICFPLAHRNLSHSYTVTTRVIFYTLPVMALSILINIPKFLETKVVSESKSKQRFATVSILRFNPILIVISKLIYLFCQIIFKLKLSRLWLPFTNHSIQQEEIERFIRLSGFSSTSITQHHSLPSNEKPDYVVDNETVLVYDNVTTYSIAVTELR